MDNLSMLSTAFIVFSVFNLSFCQKKMYTNYTLYRVVPTTEKELNFIKSLEQKTGALYWTEPGRLEKPVDVLIGPEWKNIFLRCMKENNYKYDVVMDDLQSAIDNVKVNTYIRRNMDSYNWHSYYRLKDIYYWFYDLEKQYPGEVTVIVIGITHERRKLLAVRVLLKNANVRSTAFIEGGIHAREWISVSFVTYLLNEILTKGHQGVNSIWKKLAHLYEWYFIPVANPDGYEYSHTTDRMWRKNRYNGHGVDVNRNFDIAFGTVGVSAQPTSTTYCGTHAFSENESQAIADFVRSKKGNIEYYLAFHSYGQYIILPYVFTKKHLSNYDEFVPFLNNASNIMGRRYGKKYWVGTAAETIGYTTSGVSMCWAKANLDIPYAATFELRDTGPHGFILPEDQIIPTCLEVLDALEYILQPKSEKFKPLNHKKNSPYDKLNSSGRETTLNNFLKMLTVFFNFRF